tara:strand:- start:416 stop:640 length:225 start_codon:yes stop_codon:yes gene_type:complete
MEGVYTDKNGLFCLLIMNGLWTITPDEDTYPGNAIQLQRRYRSIHIAWSGGTLEEEVNKCEEYEGIQCCGDGGG